MSRPDDDVAERLLSRPKKYQLPYISGGLRIPFGPTPATPPHYVFRRRDEGLKARLGGLYYPKKTPDKMNELSKLNYQHYPSNAVCNGHPVHLRIPITSELKIVDIGTATG